MRLRGSMFSSRNHGGWRGGRLRRSRSAAGGRGCRRTAAVRRAAGRDPAAWACTSGRLSLSTSSSVTAASQCCSASVGQCSSGRSSGLLRRDDRPLDDHLARPGRRRASRVAGARATGGVASTRRRPTPGGATRGLRACGPGSRSCRPRRWRSSTRSRPAARPSPPGHRRRSWPPCPRPAPAWSPGVRPSPACAPARKVGHDAGDVRCVGRRGGAGRPGGDRLCAALTSLSRCSRRRRGVGVGRLRAHHLGVRPGPRVAQRLQLVAADRAPRASAPRCSPHSTWRRSATTRVIHGTSRPGASGRRA